MEREQLVGLINSNGGFNGHKLPYECPFDELELEGILEYGSPEAFSQQKYSDQVVYYSDQKNRVHAAHAPIAFTTVQDISTIRELGLSMRVIKRDPRERRLQTRRKNILAVLNSLPEKFRQVSKAIRLDDLDKLSELCLVYKKPNVQRLVLVLLNQRANASGIYVSRDELADHFGIKISGMGFLEDLRNAGLFEEQVAESVEIQANNILFDFKNKGHLTRRQLMFAQTRVSEFRDRYPGIFTARKNLGVVVALMSMRLTKDVKLVHLLKEHAEIFGLDKMVRRDNYNAIKRAEDRSEVYMNELNTGI